MERGWAWSLPCPWLVRHTTPCPALVCPGARHLQSETHQHPVTASSFTTPAPAAPDARGPCPRRSWPLFPGPWLPGTRRWQPVPVCAGAGAALSGGASTLGTCWDRVATGPGANEQTLSSCPWAAGTAVLLICLPPPPQPCVGVALPQAPKLLPAADKTSSKLPRCRPIHPPSLQKCPQSCRCPRPVPVPSLGGIFLIMVPRIYCTLPRSQPRPEVVTLPRNAAGRETLCTPTLSRRSYSSTERVGLPPWATQLGRSRLGWGLLWPPPGSPAIQEPPLPGDRQSCFHRPREGRPERVQTTARVSARAHEGPHQCGLRRSPRLTLGLGSRGGWAPTE